VPKERILLTHEPRGKGDQKHAGWNYKVDFVYSDDFFKTQKVAASKGNKFMLTKNYLFVAQVVDQSAQEVMLLTANSQDVVYDMKPIETSSSKFREHSYTFLDTSEESVLLHINHFGEYSKFGHIYISDAAGLSYSQSLKYNVRSSNGQCDFEKVNSLEGLFIANSYDPEYMKDADQQLEEQEHDEEESMDEKKTKKSEMKDAYKDFITTVITYNKGGSWRRIKAPDRDSEGKKYECEGDCYLNLHGISGDYPPFYSVDSAAGIIIANGNVGKYLSHEQGETSTYLTRDGGLNWFEIRKNPHIYEIGDHGALIIIADTLNPTNTIYYSWDEGLSFQDLRISDENFMIENVIIEPSSTGQHFIVYGKQTKKGKKKGVVIGVDFSSLHEPQCRNPDNPDAADSDYEKWTPNDGIAGHECLLGRKVIYIRRKREAQCYNGLDFERKTIVENCSCTEEDFECDFGFYRSGPSEPCTRADKKDSEIEIQKPPANCNGYYTISKGYRRIPGDTCVNGLNYDPYVVPCPYSGVLGFLNNATTILLVVICLALIYLAFTRNYLKNISELLPTQQPKQTRIPDYVHIVIIF
jgi:hypothetical protein